MHATTATHGLGGGPLPPPPPPPPPPPHHSQQHPQSQQQQPQPLHPSAVGQTDQHQQYQQHQQRLSTSSSAAGGMPPGLGVAGRDLLAADNSDDGLQSGDDLDDDQDSPGGGTSRSRLGKRKRPISVSCECCKQRKVKCDRGQPSCGWCKRNGVYCEYRERKKPGLRAGYGRELEQRLDKLEEILRSHSEIIQSTLSAYAATSSAASHHDQHHHHHHSNSAPSVRTSNPSLPSDHGTPRDAPMFRPPTGSLTGDALRTPQAETALFLQKPASFGHATQAMDFGMPAMSSAHDSLQTHMPLTGVSPSSQMGSMQPSAAAHDYYGTGPASQHSQQQPPMSSPGMSIAQGQTQIAADQDLPPYDLLYALTDLYFKHVNTWCPILHRKSTLDSLFGPSTLDETDRVLLYAIVATTLRYSTDARLTPERRQHYHTISKQKVILYGMENSSVKSLQALVILALDLCGDSNGPPGWNIMALITRSVVQLGLAVESTSFMVSPNFTSIYTLRAMILPESKDFVEDESRRRLFWMVYLLDRYATIATAFDFALDDKEIDRTLPCRDDLWLKNTRVETRWFNYEIGAGDSTSSPSMTTEQQQQFDHHLVNRPENLGAFSYYIEILHILSRIHLFLRQPVDITALSDVESWQLRYKELDQLMTSWKFGLPGEYGNMAKLFQPGFVKNLSCAWVMLHATYHTAVIRLHSSAAYPTTRSPIFTPSYSASQRCHGAVENIAALAEAVVQNNMLCKLGPPFAFTLWVSARLLLVHGSTVEHNVSPRIAFLVETLREMGRWWPVAERYARLLGRVLDEYDEFEAGLQKDGQGNGGDGDRKENKAVGGGVGGGAGGQGSGGKRTTPSSVKILADMRRTAFDLDFLISRQPRPGHGVGGPGGAVVAGGRRSRLASITPVVRTPQSAELEYLDVFDFFNVPRLPLGNTNGNVNNGNGTTGNEQDGGGGSALDGIPGDREGSGDENGAGDSIGGVLANEFNITNFTMDVDSDWFRQ